MSTFVPQQKVITVANDDESINGAISEQNSLGWQAVQLVLSGSDVIILFAKTQLAVDE